jgi:predicted nucleic acid-binding protein
MILVDTSIWIDHLRKTDPVLFSLLREGRVISHPLVIGEIAVGSFKQREVILDELRRLPEALEATHKEALRFLSHHSLSGLGIGYIDVHLLAAVQLTPEAMLWTRDKRLVKVAELLNLAFLGA